jgi:excisionase family DNA binding protein
MDNISTNSKQSEVTPGGLLNRREIAQFLGVSERTIGNMVAQRRIPIVRWGRNVRFDPMKVRRALCKYEIEEL